MARGNGVHSARHKALAADLALQRRPCWLCGQKIDYSLGPDDPMHYQYDHAFSVIAHPELEFDPGNGRPSHAKCNKNKGSGPPMPTIGETSEEW